VSLVWSSDSTEENARRLADPWRDEAEIRGLLGIRWEVVTARLERLLHVPALLALRRRIARLLSNK